MEWFQRKILPYDRIRKTPDNSLGYNGYIILSILFLSPQMYFGKLHNPNKITPIFVLRPSTTVPFGNNLASVAVDFYPASFCGLQQMTVSILHIKTRSLPMCTITTFKTLVVLEY
jgi:hypothetical protein